MKILSGLFLIMDDAKEQGDLRFTKDCTVEILRYDEIPIILDAAGGKLHNVLGFAEVKEYGNVLVYEGQVFGEKEEMLHPSVCHVFYPCAVGKIVRKNAKGLITHFKLTDILIAMKNSDSRIPHVQMEIPEEKAKVCQCETPQSDFGTCIGCGGETPQSDFGTCIGCGGEVQ